MARLTFRQGIVRYQKDTLNNQGFLSESGGYISLVVSPDPTIVAFIQGDHDYLFTETVTIPNAWGPFTPGSERWLYWELDKITGVRTFGSTDFEPVEQSSAPNPEGVGHMWFDTTKNTWFEYSGSGWSEVIRVFACKLDSLLTPRSMSVNAPEFDGTQVGMTVPASVGSLVFDASGKPIRSGDGKFFTTEDIFTSGIPTGASVKINNILISGQAQTYIAAYQVVEFYSFNKIVPASPFSQSSKVYGIIEEDVITNDVVNFVTEGLIYNPDWDWETEGASVNDPLFINHTGEIQLTPSIPDQLPVGTVIGPQEILFSPRSFSQSSTGGSAVPTTFSDLADTPQGYIGYGGYNIRVNSSETGLEYSLPPTYLTSVNWGDIGGLLSNQVDLTTALSAKFDKAGGALDPLSSITLQGGELFGLPIVPSSSNAATSKHYVDSLVGSGIRWIPPVLTVTFKGELNDPSIYTPNGKQDTYVVGPSPSGDFSAFAPGTLVSYDGTNWIDIVPGNTLQVGDRLGTSIFVTTFPPTNVTPSLAPFAGKILTITDNTPGSLTWDDYVPNEHDTVFLNNTAALNFGHSYTFSGTWGSGTYGIDFSWIEIQAKSELQAGTNLEFSGTTINVSPQGTGSGLHADTWDNQEANVVSPANGEALLYSAGTNEWVNGSISRIQNSTNNTFVDANTTALQITGNTGINVSSPNGGVDLSGEQIVITSTNGGDVDVRAGSDNSGNGGNIILTAGSGDGFYGEDGAIHIKHTTPSSAAEIRLFEGSSYGTSSISLSSPDSLPGDVSFIFPPSNGSAGNVLTSDGNGVTSWNAPSVPYDIGFSVMGAVSDGDYLGYFTAPRDFSFDVSGSGTVLIQSRIGASGTDAVYEIGKVQQPGNNDVVLIASIVVTDGATSASYGSSQPETIAQGTMLYCKCITAAGMEDVGVTVRANTL